MADATGVEAQYHDPCLSAGLQRHRKLLPSRKAGAGLTVMIPDNSWLRIGCGGVRGTCTNARDDAVRCRRARHKKEET